MIAVYYIIKMLGWTDGPMLRVAMICVYAGGAGVDYHIAKGFFDTVPIALDEAARITKKVEIRQLTTATSRVFNSIWGKLNTEKSVNSFT